MADTKQSLARRSVLAQVGIGTAALGMAGASGTARAQTANASWQPALHAQDDWLSQVPGLHRFVFDSTSPPAAGTALLYAHNYFLANKKAYNLDPGDLAIVIVLRHFATPFAYTDAVWAKYGPVLSEMMAFSDPKTKALPTSNLYNAPGYGMSLTNFGTTLDSLIEQGVQFAVCDMATHFLANALAEKTGGKEEDIYTELAGGLIAHARLVPAGIVAVNRAQERGYSLAYVT